MKSFIIDSIDLKFCSLTDSKILNKIKLCWKCKKIPLPQYRSYKSQDKVFCKVCYFSTNQNPSHLIFPLENEYNPLQELVINCTNEECKEIFDIYSLDNFSSHTSICRNKVKEIINHCKKCNTLYKKTEVHDCYSILSNKIINLTTRLNQLELKTSEVLDNHTNKNEKKVDELENIIKNQNHSIENLIQLVAKIEVNYSNLLQSLKCTSSSQMKIDVENNDNFKILEKNESAQQYNLNYSKNPKLISVSNISLKENLNINTINDFEDLSPKDITNKEKLQTSNLYKETDIKQEITPINSTKFTQIQKVKNISRKSYEHIITLLGHEKTVKTLIQLKDGRIVSGSYDKSIKFWDFNNFDEAITYNDNRGDINSLAEVSDDRIIYASNNSIKLFDVYNHRVICDFKGHTKYVNSIIYLGKNIFASASQDSSIKLWDLSKSKCISTFTGIGESFNTVIHLKDGRLATCSTNNNDNPIKIWDLNSGKDVILPNKIEGVINTICQISDGRLVSGYNNGNVKVWDLKSTKQSLSSMGHNKSVWSVININEDNFASSSSDNSIKIWDICELQCIQTLDGHQGNILSLALLKDGKLASGSKDTTIKIWGY